MRDSPDTSTDQEDDTVEVLPDRFDSHGRPLDKRSSGRTWAARHGEFEYKDPQKNNGWHVQGQWGIAGTDADRVQHLAEGVREILDSFGGNHRTGVLGVVSGVLEGVNNASHLLADDGDDDRKRKRQSKERRRPASTDSYDSYEKRDDGGRVMRKRRRSWGR